MPVLNSIIWSILLAEIIFTIYFFIPDCNIDDKNSSGLMSITEVIPGFAAIIIAILIMAYDHDGNSFRDILIRKTINNKIIKILLSIFTLVAFMILSYAPYGALIGCGKPLTHLVFILFLILLWISFFLALYFFHNNRNEIKIEEFNTKLDDLKKCISKKTNADDKLHEICSSIQAEIQQNHPEILKVIEKLRIKLNESKTSDTHVSYYLKIFTIMAKEAGKQGNHVPLSTIIKELAGSYQKTVSDTYTDTYKKVRPEEDFLIVESSFASSVYDVMQEIFTIASLNRLDLAIREGMKNIFTELETTLKSVAETIKKTEQNYDDRLKRKILARALREYIFLYSSVGKKAIIQGNINILVSLLGPKGIFSQIYQLVSTTYNFRWLEMKELNQTVQVLLLDATIANMDHVVANGMHMLIERMKSELEHVDEQAGKDKPYNLIDKYYISEKYVDMISSIIAVAIEHRRMAIINTGFGRLMASCNVAIELTPKIADKNILENLAKRAFSIVISHSTNLLIDRFYRKQVQTSHFGYPYTTLLEEKIIAISPEAKQYTLTELAVKMPDAATDLFKMYSTFLKDLWNRYTLERSSTKKKMEEDAGITYYLDEPLPSIFILNTFFSITEELLKCLSKEKTDKKKKLNQNFKIMLQTVTDINTLINEDLSKNPESLHIDAIKDLKTATNEAHKKLTKFYKLVQKNAPLDI